MRRPDLVDALAAAKTARFLKAELKRAGVTYATLAETLKEHGLEETEASVSSKLARGTFAATFLLACLAALEIGGATGGFVTIMPTEAVFLVALGAIAALIIALTRLSIWAQRRQIQDEKEEDDRRRQAYKKRYANAHQRDGVALAARINAVAEQLRFRQHQQERQDRERGLREKVTIAVIAVTGVIALGSAWIFYLQLRSMQDDQRAWIAPWNVAINSMAKGHGLKLTFSYFNTGKEPAIGLRIAASPTTFPQTKWNDGTAAAVIINYTRDCLNLSNDIIPQGRIAYPSISITAPYNLQIDTAEVYFRTPVRVSDDLIAGKEVFVIMGCMAYMSIGRIHHSAFCYDYTAGQVEPYALSMCLYGNTAN